MSNASGDFLRRNSGSLEKHDAFKFEKIGDTLAGVIVSEPREITYREEPRLVVEVCDDAGKTWALFVKPGFMASALQDALVAIGAEGLAEGGRIAVQFSDTKDTGKASPAKLFVAEYQPPAPRQVGGGLLSGSASQAPAV